MFMRKEALAKIHRNNSWGADFGVFSPQGGTRVGSIGSARHKALRQSMRVNEYNQKYVIVLAWRNGPATFGSVRIARGTPPDLDAADFNRYSKRSRSAGIPQATPTGFDAKYGGSVRSSALMYFQTIRR